MEKDKLLADSDFFIALYKKGDSNRQQALALLKQVNSQKQKMITSVFSFSEVVTVLSQRVAHKVAVRFMDDIKNSGVIIVNNNDRVFKKAKEIFKSQKSKDVSFVDVWNIAYCRISGLPEILSFDKDYKKNNLKRFGID